MSGLSMLGRVRATLVAAAVAAVAVLALGLGDTEPGDPAPERSTTAGDTRGARVGDAETDAGTVADRARRSTPRPPPKNEDEGGAQDAPRRPHRDEKAPTSPTPPRPGEVRRDLPPVGAAGPALRPPTPGQRNPAADVPVEDAPTTIPTPPGR